jgi:RimJ/RimL family protein N-acetyltransferase
VNKHISSIPSLKHKLVLRDGSEINIRLLFHGDKQAYIDMFNSLSKETKTLRYHYVKLDMSEQEAEEYCNLNLDNEIALIAERREQNSTRIAGIGRYDRIGDSQVAEISFLVDDRDQGQGICTHLLKDLTGIAKERGIKRFIGILTNKNVIMLDILKKFRPDMGMDIDCGDIIVSFNL